MAGLKASEAATIAHGYWVGEPPGGFLGRFAIDTRTMQEGDTFVALETDRRDGHDFLEMARHNRALAALVERPDPSLDLPQLVVESSYRALHSLARVRRQAFKRTIIGITGSYGKTTVKEQLGRVLGSQWYRTPGNLNNTLGVPLCLLELEGTHDAGAIIEAGINRKGEMDILADLIDPDLSIVTAVGPAHLEALGDLEGVAAEKSRLAHATRSGGTAVLPVDLLRYASFRDIPGTVGVHAVSLPGSKPVPSGLPGNVTIFNYDWTAETGQGGGGALRLADSPGSRWISVRTESPGMTSNLSLVVHVALQLGVPPRTVEACLESWKPYSKRGEVFLDRGIHYFVDCYNANPVSLTDSVLLFRNRFKGQAQIYVLGSMDELGEQSAKWHRDTARTLGLPESARVHLLGHGAEDMAAGFREGGFPVDRIAIETSLDGIRSALEGFAGAVFLKGSRSFALENLVPKGARKC